MAGVFFIPAAVYLVQVYALRHWIVDDAGISFVYARNIAGGAGFVSQPGLNPVEGYSNFSWVMVMALFYLLKVFDLALIPKLVSLFFAAAMAFFLTRLGNEVFHFKIPTTLLTLTTLAVCTPFVVWTTSGLENPLYVFLIVFLAWSCLQYLQNPALKADSWGIFISLIAAVIAMTRPEGFLYFSAFPIVWFAANWRTDWWKIERIRPLLWFGLGIVLTYGGFLLFRYATFGDWLPNTYYVKGGSALDTAREVLLLYPASYNRLFELFAAAANRFSGWMIAFLAFAVVFLGIKKQLGRGMFILLLFLGLSGINYIFLPNDWMKEFRFATPFFPFFYMALLALFERFCVLWVRSPRVQLAAVTGLAVLFLAFSVKIFYPRAVAFINQPTVPFENVKIDLGDRYNQYAHVMELESASLLVPDMGGTLYVSQLRVYDLGGLCDRQIARTLSKDQPAFYQYVFQEIRPTFIHVHWPWSQLANFDADPRFRADYLPITENKDENGKVVSGDYIRKDAISGKESLLTKLFP